jgi:hypothetical protein
MQDIYGDESSSNELLWMALGPAIIILALVALYFYMHP